VCHGTHSAFKVLTENLSKKRRKDEKKFDKKEVNWWCLDEDISCRGEEEGNRKRERLMC
tara:strand:+ start:185 stop:361 length:177 start_codon:yes stop_codon:yes gene_type:complete